MNSTTLSPVTCAAWCEDGTGHAEATHAEDQYCMSHSVEIDVHASEDLLSVYREQEPGGPVLVNLSVNGDAGAYLGLSQLARLRDELSAILESESNDPPPTGADNAATHRPMMDAR